VLFIVTGPARLDRLRWTLRVAATEAAICDGTWSGSETAGAPDPPFGAAVDGWCSSVEACQIGPFCVSWEQAVGPTGCGDGRASGMWMDATPRSAKPAGAHPRGRVCPVGAAHPVRSPTLAQSGDKRPGW